VAEREATLPVGAFHDAATWRTCFRVWAPRARRVEVVLPAGESGGEEPGGRSVPLAAEPEADGYHAAEVADAPPGCLYRYRLTDPDGRRVERPDPASRSQPRGVHGPSAVVAPAPAQPSAGAGWAGLPLADHVIYEIHVGTFTAAATFDGVAARLDELADLGVTALELMPVCPFPGHRNWGYDGVFPYAVQASYGGAEGLRRLVEAAHRRGLAVILDAVYNHVGPEGNHLADFGPYFTPRHTTPWGAGLDLDGPRSAPVRRFFRDAAVAWITDFGLDGLRLDAVDAIGDASEPSFLCELTAAVQGAGRRLGRRVHLFAESAVNTDRFLRPRRAGGCGMDAQWCDDLHHALHALLSGESCGYYRDFGSLHHLADAYRHGFVHRRRWDPQRPRVRGAADNRPDASIVHADRLVVYAQNHDQVGNRPRGRRLASLVDAPRLRLAAGATLLSPFLPLLFMGEEHGEEAPFLFFTDHGDAGLTRAVRSGRRRELAALFAEPVEAPDPGSPDSFAASRPRGGLAGDSMNAEGAGLRALYRELLRWRRAVPALARPDLEAQTVEVRTATGEGLAEATASAGEAPAAAPATSETPAAGVLSSHRRHPAGDVLVVLRFAAEGTDDEATVRLTLPAGPWRVAVDSASKHWAGEPAAPAVRPELKDAVEAAGCAAVPAVGSTPELTDRRVELPLPPFSFLLLVQADGPAAP
jgi:maltooligosyltrehalose trehalohydrolase